MCARRTRTLCDVMVDVAGVQGAAVSERPGAPSSVCCSFWLCSARPGLMGSALVEDAGPRTALQIFGGITAVGFGATASVLAWRWWGGRVD